MSPRTSTRAPEPTGRLGGLSHPGEPRVGVVVKRAVGLAWVQRIGCPDQVAGHLADAAPRQQRLRGPGRAPAPGLFIGGADDRQPFLG